MWCVWTCNKGQKTAIYIIIVELPRSRSIESTRILFTTIALPIVAIAAMLQLHRVATSLLAATAAAANAVPRAEPSSCSGDTSSTDAVQAILDSDQSPSKALDKNLETLLQKETNWVNNLWRYAIRGREPGSLRQPSCCLCLVSLLLRLLVSPHFIGFITHVLG